MMLKFMRKLWESEANRSSTLSIPRPIANMWRDEGYTHVEMQFDGEKLIIMPEITKVA